MSQSEKSLYFNKLKEAGVQFSKHYRDYTTDELKTAWSMYEQATAPPSAVWDERPNIPPPPAEPPPAHIPRVERDPDEMPGQRLNSKPEDEPIRVDENGLVWYQEEVRKPATARPRGRRVLKYNDPGSVTKTDQEGRFTESFEVAGSASVPSEVKITMPSYQVGIYKDKRFPFKIHVYNEHRGFDLFEVETYFGGPEMVPPDVKRVYVENVLCYDIRTVVRAIQAEYRQLQLAGRIPQ